MLMLRREVRIPHEPALTVPRHVQFRHDANAQVRGMGDDRCNVALCIPLATGAGSGELRVDVAVQPEALVVAQVQMQHI